MKLLVTALIFTAQVLGCSRPQLLLHDPGRVVLAKDGQAVELSDRNPLFIRWSLEGNADSTRAAIEGIETPVTVAIVEANEQFLRVKSEAWKSPEYLPETYLRAKEIRVIARSGRYKKPTVSIPLERIEAITVFDDERRKPEQSGYSRRNLVVGALGGFTFGATLAGADWIGYGYDRDDPWILKGNEALATVTICTAAGAVVYPTYKTFWPQSRQMFRGNYPIGGKGGWRISIRR